MAQEVLQFQNALAQALRGGVAHHDPHVDTLLADHLAFMTNLEAEGMLARFLSHDDFHRRMMEGLQIGLAYYYLAAVEAFASKRRNP